MNKKLMKLLPCLVLTLALFICSGYAQNDEGPASGMWVQSQSAIIRIGVWDKLRRERSFDALFIVTGPDGKEYRSKKHSSSGVEWVKTIFPDDFDKYPKTGSEYVKYSWKCLIENSQIGEGEFYWGRGKASDNKYKP